ncbi:hypothetical protein [Xanthomonas citri]|uniref:hypothetical protein n=1 Tax=Xanthomonas citri TaxID=346 RepID=UPI001931BBB0|nr:hypothetical protein [Xanthomonas citri]
MSILLTLFRSNVCWAKPNHAFFTVNTLLQFFFYPPSLRAMSAPANRPARGRTGPTEKRARPTAFSKKHFFSAVFFLFVRLHACPNTSTARQRSRCDGMACRLSAS